MSIFQDKVVWVTGASSGIGEETVLQFNELGAKVVLSARNEEKLMQVQSKLKNPENALILPLDLEKSEGFSDLAKQVADHFGSIDILIGLE